MQLSNQLDMTDALDCYLTNQISVSELQVRLAGIAWDILLDDDTPSGRERAVRARAWARRVQQRRLDRGRAEGTILPTAAHTLGTPAHPRA